MALKITYLLLENFECIMSGLKKPKIEINLRESIHPINVLVGPIGSGKTFILSHLQPFATLGTLDIRNQDDQILTGKDGLKIIEYLDDLDLYEIRHEYIWNEKSANHTTKSYIYKNGEDLNPSGNVSSFKYIISTEFGLEMSYLRLLRLGANVTGILELSATERKTYVAGMLERADIILALNKKFREELRDYNAQLSVLANKLAQLGMSKEADYEIELEELSDELSKLDETITTKRNTIVKYESEIALAAPHGYNALMDEIKNLIEEFDSARDERNTLEAKLMKLEENPDSNNIAKEIGSLESEKKLLIESITECQHNYGLLESDIRALEEKIFIMKNDTHLVTLRDTYESLKEELATDKCRLNGFRCKYTSSYLKNLINELHNIDLLIDDITQFDSGIVRKLYMSDASIISWSRNQGDILTGRKVNLQKKINNLSYSASYTNTEIMFTPPFCPTSDCPYKKTHPYTLTKGKDKKEINSEVESLKAEIEKLDREMYSLAEYPVIYTKISSFKNQYSEIVSVLKSIGALETDNALLILTRLDKRKWYNYDRIIDMQELAIINESYHERLENLYKIKEELDLYESESIDILTKKVSDSQSNLSVIKDKMESDGNRIAEINERLEYLTELYELMLDKVIEESRLKDMNHNLDNLKKHLEEKSKLADRISPYIMIIEKLKEDITSLTLERDQINHSKNQLTAKLNDIKFTKQEVSDITLYQKYLTLIVNATSSKEGIPLHLINDFVKGCKDIVNDLTFNIFEDDIMLEDFKIDEKEFYIPYSINGKVIQDVTKASQGQKSLFSIAIAFAFLQHARIKYNITLLDEIDGPLHNTEKAKCLSMVLRQMKALGAVQSFFITHSSLENLPVNFILTADEDLNLQNGSTVIRLYE